MKPKVPLGKMLVDGGFIDEFQFKAALGHQRRYGGRLASQILALGFLPERTLAVMLSRQQGFPAVVLAQSAFRVSNADALPKDLALRYLALPALVEKDRIVLVVANPSDMKALDEIRFIAGKRVVPHIALDTLLRDMIQKLYEARAIGHETFVFGDLADTNVSENGHIELVSEQTSVEPPRKDAAGLHIATQSGPASAPPPSPPTSAGSAPKPIPTQRTATAPLPSSPAMPAVSHAPAPSTAPIPQAPPMAAATYVPPTPSSPGMPATLPPQMSMAPPAGRSVEPPTPPLVLVVDGDQELVPRIVPALVDRGLRVVTAPDGMTATQILRTQTPDAVALEAALQGVHGFELCQKLRASRRFLETPVVLMTSEYKGDGYRRDLRALFGADLVLEKPFPIPLLVRRIEELLARSRRLEPRMDAAQQRSLAAFQQASQLLNENRVDEAIAVLQRGLSDDGLSEHLHFQLANAYRRKTMDLHALAEFERAIELRPDFYPALRNLATLYQERGFRRKSFELWERAMEHCPDDETRRKLREHLLGYFN